jgi:hypothetical protein
VLRPSYLDSTVRHLDVDHVRPGLAWATGLILGVERISELGAFHVPHRNEVVLDALGGVTVRAAALPTACAPVAVVESHRLQRREWVHTAR